MEKVTVYLINTKLVKENLELITNLVDSSRKEKADKLINEKDKLLSLGAAYLVKKCLGTNNIKTLETGKPYIDGGPYFSISHSGNYAAFAVHPSRSVGLDIEKLDEEKVNAIKYVSNEEEKKIDDVGSLFRMWSNKESLIKCLPNGSKDVRLVVGLPLEGLREIDKEEYFTKSLIYDGYSLSLTLMGKEEFEIDTKLVDQIKV